MKTIWVRDANTEKDARTCSEWIARIADINLLDPAVFAYPSTRVLCAYQKTEDGDDKPLLYVPIQRPLMLESLAPAPGTEGLTEAVALKEVVQDAVSTAHRSGAGEIYFLCRDERVIKFAQAHGFKQVNSPLLRMKI